MIDNNWIIVDLPFGPILELPKNLKSGEQGLLEHRPSFSHTIGCKAGILIELDNKKQYLIGDINELGGVCDDCKSIYDDDIVHRYKIVWEKNIK